MFCRGRRLESHNFFSNLNFHRPATTTAITIAKKTKLPSIYNPILNRENSPACHHTLDNESVLSQHIEALALRLYATSVSPLLATILFNMPQPWSLNEST